MVRAGRRGAERAKRGTVGFATAVKESRVGTDPDLIDTSPASTEPVFGPPEPIDGGGEDYQVLVGGQEEQATEKVANFDDAVRIAEEPDTSELEDLEEDAEVISVAKAEKPEGDVAREEPESAEQPAVDLTPMGEKRGGVTESEEIDYELPDSERVLERGAPDKGPDKKDHEAVARTLLEALGHFGVEARIVGTVTGPHVSRYELKLAPGTKVSKITQLKDDLAYALASTDIRILAPIPGKQAVGVEVPEPATAPRSPRRHLRRPAAGSIPAGRLARQGHLGQRRLDRPAEDAARADRRHHRLGQVGQRQRDPQLDPAPRLARTRCGWCWSTRSGSSSTTTSGFRTC